jgi:HSP20 family protein
MPTLNESPAQAPALNAEEDRKNYLIPAIDVSATEEGYLLRAELPGVDRDGLEITVEKHELTIVGHRKFPQPAGNAVHREIRTHDFRQVCELDRSIDTTKIHALLDQGFLTITLPKAESVKPQKITVE